MFNLRHFCLHQGVTQGLPLKESTCFILCGGFLHPSYIRVKNTTWRWPHNFETDLVRLINLSIFMSLCCGRIIRMGPGGLTKLSERVQTWLSVSWSRFEQLDPQSCKVSAFSASWQLVTIVVFWTSEMCDALSNVLSDDKSRPIWGHLPAQFGREHKAGLGSGLLAPTWSDIRTITQAGGRCLSHRGVVQMTTRPSRTTAVSCSVITGSPVSAWQTHQVDDWKS